MISLHLARLDTIRQIITLFVQAQRHADVPAYTGALNAPTTHAPPTITDRRGALHSFHSPLRYSSDTCAASSRITR